MKTKRFVQRFAATIVLTAGVVFALSPWASAGILDGKASSILSGAAHGVGR